MGGMYAHANLWEMAKQMFHSLTIGLGELQNDTVLVRSYSVLILMEMVYNSQHFVRSVSAQLRVPGFANLTHVEQRPAITDELLPMVEGALAQVHTRC